MKKRKIFIMVISLCTSLLIATANTSVLAKATAIEINADDGKVYEYQYAALRTSAIAAVLNGSTDSGAKLYNDFLKRKISIRSYYDDVKGKYIDFKDISQAAISAITSNTSFDFNKYTEDDSTPSITVNPLKVELNTNGDITINEKSTETDVDMTTIQCTNAVDFYSTIVTFKLKLTNPQDYDVKVKGSIATYYAGTGLFGVSINEKLVSTDLQVSDFVVTKKTTQTPAVDLSTLTLDTTTLPFTTIAKFKLNVNDPQNYNVVVKGKTTSFNTTTVFFGAPIDGILTASDFKISDFVITKK